MAARLAVRWGALGSLVVLAALSASTTLGAAVAVPLTVTVTGLKNTTGQLLVAVYDSKDGWLDIKKAVARAKLPITGGTVVVPAQALKPGVYAVASIHDENMNDKLDMRVFPPGPAEGTAVSNDATGTFGPPSWSDARFAMGDRGAAITVKMRY